MTTIIMTITIMVTVTATVTIMIMDISTNKSWMTAHRFRFLYG
jgi:hypothetical protein